MTDFEVITEVLERQERCVLVGIDRGDTQWPLEESLAELERLANTAGAEVVATTYQRMTTPNPRTFIGSGKATEVAELARAHDAHLVIFDDELSPSQQGNLEKVLRDCKVIDRTALILDIFALHATTREGLLQVRLAQNQYLYPRLRGMWAHLASNRMGGGVGSRFGEGESQLEVDRRMVRKRIDRIRIELKKLEQDRNTQRKQRYEDGVAKIVLVGYTNAGKSTTLNALTGADVLAEDKLFATLDSTTRRLVLPEGREVTITDTVGFIQKLPTTLIEAFKSTLDEVRGANLVLHVCDASSRKMDSQYKAVQDILEQIDALKIPAITVFNKCDLLSSEQLEVLKKRYPECVCMSALSGQGTEELIERVSQACGAADRTISVLVPYSKGNLVQLAHEKCTVLSVSYAEKGTEMAIRCPASLVRQFEPYLIGSMSEMLDVRFKLLNASAVMPVPTEGVECAWQLCCSQTCVVQPGERAMVHTGVAVGLPQGCAGMAISVHEVAVSQGLRFVNTPGLIDTGYRGEVCFIAQNTGNKAVAIEAGTVVGQIVVTSVATCFIGDANEFDANQEKEDAAMDKVQIDIKMLSDIEAPQYAHEADNGLDLRAAEGFELAPGERCEASLGFALSIPQGYMAQVQPRSGLALKTGLTIIDSPCVLPNPCSEVKVVFVNLDPSNTISINRGERVAQLVVLPCVSIRAVLVDELEQTQRGADGFGSSGIGDL